MTLLASPGANLVRTAGGTVISQEVRGMRVSSRAVLRPTSETTENAGLPKAHAANITYR